MTWSRGGFVGTLVAMSWTLSACDLESLGISEPEPPNVVEMEEDAEADATGADAPEVVGADAKAPPEEITPRPEAWPPVTVPQGQRGPGYREAGVKSAIEEEEPLPPEAYETN